VTPDALAAIHAAAFTDPRPWSAAEFAALMAGPGVFLHSLARGLVMGRVILDEAELLTIAVHPQAQGQGLGAQLLARFETESLARGATTGFLEVSAANPGAQRLYARAGWRETGRRRGYYRDGSGAPCDAILMARTFAQPRA
jgi:ribosomal-protein-alanine N-acetyltransferase